MNDISHTRQSKRDHLPAMQANDDHEMSIDDFGHGIAVLDFSMDESDRMAGEVLCDYPAEITFTAVDEPIDDFAHGISALEEDVEIVVGESPKDATDLSTKEISVEPLQEISFNFKVQHKPYDLYLYLHERMNRTHPMAFLNDEAHVFDPSEGIYRPLSKRDKYVFRQIMPRDSRRYIVDSTIKEVHAWAACERDLPAYTLQTLPRVQNYILFRNGILDINTGERVNGVDVKGLMFTHSINADFPFDFDPSGFEFEKFLEATFAGVPGGCELLQELIGLAISDIRTVKKAFFLKGPKDTGKSVIESLLNELLGKKYTSHVTLHQLNEKFSPSEVQGQWLNIGAETKASKIRSADVFKSLTGGGLDVVNAQQKHTGSAEFRNTALLLFLMNKVPSLAAEEDVDSVADRIVFVPFLNQVPIEEQDHDLEKKLVTELPYIVAWGIEGLRRLLKNNFCFSKCEASDALLAEFRTQNSSRDILSEFCNEVLAIDAGASLPSNVLDDAFQQYCFLNNKAGSNPRSWEKALTSVLGDHFEKSKVNVNGGRNNKRGVKGIAFKDPKNGEGDAI